MNPDPYGGVWGGRHCRDSPIQTERSCNCRDGNCEASDMYFQQLEEVRLTVYSIMVMNELLIMNVTGF